MANWELRRARPGDEAALAFIHTESWKTAFREILSPEVLAPRTDRQRITGLYQSVLDRDFPRIILASVAGEPCGMVVWGESRDGLEAAELICIHVLPNGWRRGCGSAMMGNALQEMKAAGYTAAVLWVFTANTRARAFYEKLEFSPTGKTKNTLGAEELLYKKEL